MIAIFLDRPVTVIGSIVLIFVTGVVAGLLILQRHWHMLRWRDGGTAMIARFLDRPVAKVIAIVIGSNVLIFVTGVLIWQVHRHMLRWSAQRVSLGVSEPRIIQILGRPDYVQSAPSLRLAAWEQPPLEGRMQKVYVYLSLGESLQVYVGRDGRVIRTYVGESR